MSFAIKAANVNGGGNLCPSCKFGTLRQSKFGNRNATYCSNYKTPNINCKYKGTIAVAKPINQATEIATCTTLSTEQQAIIDCVTNTNDNIVINALAGTGKTFTLIQCIKALTDRNLSTMYLVFGKRDQLSAVDKVCGKALVKTSNGAGNAILTAYARLNKLGRIKVDTLLPYKLLRNQWEKEKLIVGNEWHSSKAVYMTAIELCNKVRNTLALEHKTKPRPTDDDWSDLIVRYNLLIKDTEVPEAFSWASWLFGELVSLKNLKLNGIDLTNQIFLPVYWGMKADQQFDRILVDETQDQNYYTRMLIKAYLKNGVGKIIAVGDTNQAIYEWRGADSDAMTEIVKVMDSDPINLPLTECRRCPIAVIREAQKYVPSIQAVKGAIMGSVNHIATEEEFVAKLKKEGKGLVLSRTNFPLVKYCMHLLANGVEANIHRTNVITQILDLIDKCSPNNGHTKVEDMLFSLKLYSEEMVAKYAKNKRSGVKQTVVFLDKVNVVKLLSEGMQTTSDVKQLIDKVFPTNVMNKDGELVDSKDLDIKERSEYMVLFSTVHGSKGGEADDVYMLNNFEGDNLWQAVWTSEKETVNILYVSTTRSCKNLTYVGLNP